MSNLRNRLKLVLVTSLALNVLMLSVAAYKKDAVLVAVEGIFKSFAEPPVVSEKETLIVSEKEISMMNPKPYLSKIKTYDAGYKTKKRILFFGNSISRHGISANWDHVSGMAASSEDKDYVHTLVRMLSAKLKANIEFRIVNIADFERGYSTFDFSRIEQFDIFNPDLVIFQIGENVSDANILNNGVAFQCAYEKLVRCMTTKEKIVCLPFWPSNNKNQIITEVAIATGASIVDLSHLGGGLAPKNFARSENQYSHPGVAAHPGNHGMLAIAKQIFTVAHNLLK